MQFDWCAFSTVLAVSLIGAVSDVRHFRISNWVTLPLIGSGIVFHAIRGNDVVDSLLGTLLGLGLLAVPYALRLMGAADVKLLAGVGAWLGISGTITVFAISSLVAGVYATALIIIRGQLGASVSALKFLVEQSVMTGGALPNRDLVNELASRPDRRWRVVPYGASIPFGVLGFLAWHVWPV